MGQERAPAVPLRAKQGAEARDWSWVEASVWTDRMVSALVNGVKGGRWFSLVDKVYAPAALGAAWEEVQGQSGRSGRGRAKHRTVCGTGGTVSHGTGNGIARGHLSTA